MDGTANVVKFIFERLVIVRAASFEASNYPIRHFHD